MRAVVINKPGGPEKLKLINIVNLLIHHRLV